MSEQSDYDRLRADIQDASDELFNAGLIGTDQASKLLDKILERHPSSEQEPDKEQQKILDALNQFGEPTSPAPARDLPLQRQPRHRALDTRRVGRRGQGHREREQARPMTEPVKRYRQQEQFDTRRELVDVEMTPDPNGDWCRYEPRFDAPQLSQEEVDLIEWAWSWVTNNTVMRGAIVTSRLGKLRQLITRLRAQPQASPWVPITPETMPGEHLCVHFGAKDRPVVDGYWTRGAYECSEREIVYRSKEGGPIHFTPTHWAPIIRPEPPK